MRYVQFAETVTRGQAYIHLIDVKTGIESPRVVIGKIKVHGKKRAPTPKCVSGFKCSDGFQNPFEYGHVMSWELGGPNEVENIVPMYGRWQANMTEQGSADKSWRDMEVEIKKLTAANANQFIYVALVSYDDSSDSYASQAKSFSEWQQLFDWKDYRIPTAFKVYVEPVGSDYGETLCKEFLDPKGVGKDYLKEQSELLTGPYPGTPAYSKAWSHNKLPPQDRDFLLRNMTAVAIEQSFEIHNAAKVLQVAENKKTIQGMELEEGETAIDSPKLDLWAEMPLSPKREETYNYIHEHPEEVKETLTKKFKCDLTVVQTVTTALMVEADNHGTPLKRDVKQWTKAWEGKKEIRKKALDEARKQKQYKRFEELRDKQANPPQGNQ